jgi:hypothetical protein
MRKATIMAGMLVTVAGLGVIAAPSATASPEMARTSVTVSTPAASAALSDPDSAEATYCYRAIAQPSLRVRAWPAYNAPQVGSLRNGQIVRASTRTSGDFRQLVNPYGGRWAGMRFLIRINTNRC